MNQEILEVLEFIITHPDKVIQEPTDYANQLTFAFSRKFYDRSINLTLFPKMRLHVARLDRTFISKHQDLFRRLAAKLNTRDRRETNDIWLTTSYVTNRDLLLVELGFE